MEHGVPQDQHLDRARALSFGADALAYDEARPSYPAALIDELMGGRPQKVLDVGCGTGIAGTLFVERGCRVVGVEPDERMAQVARSRDIEVTVSRFEDWSGTEHFDLVVSAQAWHWVDPSTGVVNAARVLRPGRRIGFFWSRGEFDEPLRRQMADVYEQFAPSIRHSTLLLRPISNELYPSVAASLRSSGLFTDDTITVYPFAVTYTAAEWVRLLGTMSDHRLLPDDARTRLLDAVIDVIDRVGGSFRYRYEAALVSAVRCSDW